MRAGCLTLAGGRGSGCPERPGADRRADGDGRRADSTNEGAFEGGSSARSGPAGPHWDAAPSIAAPRTSFLIPLALPDPTRQFEAGAAVGSGGPWARPRRWSRILRLNNPHLGGAPGAGEGVSVDHLLDQPRPCLATFALEGCEGHRHGCTTPGCCCGGGHRPPRGRIRCGPAGRRHPPGNTHAEPPSLPRVWSKLAARGGRGGGPPRPDPVAVAMAGPRAEGSVSLPRERNVLANIWDKGTEDVIAAPGGSGAFREMVARCTTPTPAMRSWSWTPTGSRRSPRGCPRSSDRSRGRAGRSRCAGLPPRLRLRSGNVSGRRATSAGGRGSGCCSGRRSGRSCGPRPSPCGIRP